ncbi:MAG TPA: prolipoprotein diacylglyceryl transferase [Longilinea sp.]|nr:prolipoprotein diacylglyceryl transferase [Longilinea sp.]
MTRTGFSIGPLEVHWYGVILMFGALMAAILAAREAKRRGIDPEMVWDMLPWALIGGIIGARLWHIFTPSASNVAAGLTTAYYLSHPLAILEVWNGGLGIPGAIAGGALAVWIYNRNKPISFAEWTDIVAPGLALAQAIGRWGNFVNQELYGAPSTLPWAIYIDEAHRLPAFSDVATYHPLFLYESIWNLLNLGLLLWLNRRFGEKLRHGDLFMVYMGFYAIGRFSLEFLRLDTSQIVGINANQALMIVLLVVSTVVLLWRHIPRKNNKETNTADVVEE